MDCLEQIIEEVKELVRQTARPGRGTIVVSPEVAELLGRIALPQSDKGPGADDSAGLLASLEAEVSVCARCGLSKTRTQTVFGDGNQRAELVFVGEAPGADEDRQGKPFVGAAGKYLTRIIEKGMNLSRDDVYICNVLKCRPPQNRDPQAGEVEQCEPYLRRQLELISPKVICALGGHAAKTLLKTTDSTGRLRGKWHFYQGIPLRVTYHPSYLLRCQGDEERFKSERRKVWEDVQAIMRVLDGEQKPDPDSPGAGIVA